MNRRRLPEDLLRQTTIWLNDNGCRWALIGDAAASIKTGRVRAYKIDVAVAAESSRDAVALCERLRHELNFSTLTQIPDRFGDEFAMSTLARQSDRGLLDAPLAWVLGPAVREGRREELRLFFHGRGVEQTVIDRAEEYRFSGIAGIRIAKSGDLLAYRILAMPGFDDGHDHEVIEALVNQASSCELEEARAILERIDQGREKDFERVLDNFLERRDERGRRLEGVGAVRTGARQA